jgi:hypothetical protein
MLDLRQWFTTNRECSVRLDKARKTRPYCTVFNLFYSGFTIKQTEFPFSAINSLIHKDYIQGSSTAQILAILTTYYH